jgi:preprotein translocase subunit YajC
MVGEFFYGDTLRPIATIFFVLGLIMVSVYYLLIKPSEKKHMKK